MGCKILDSMAIIGNKANNIPGNVIKIIGTPTFAYAGDANMNSAKKIVKRKLLSGFIRLLLPSAHSSCWLVSAAVFSVRRCEASQPVKYHHLEKDQISQDHSGHKVARTRRFQVATE
jgi:hypothetical protein